LAIEKTINGNRDKQMSLMAHYTREAFGKRGAALSDDMIAEMGLANIFFWTAFIIYDDFWDEDEDADSRMLPIANIFARHYVDYFSTLMPEETGFRPFFHKLMDGLDSANAWETEHCRTKVVDSVFTIPKVLPEYGDYEKKFLPAAGHAAGPVAVLAMLGYSVDSPEVKSFINYFRHYLIAMQINDDAHDWEEDMARGHISTVVDILLRDLRWGKPFIDLKKDADILKKTFWFSTIKKTEGIAITHTKKSRKALSAIGIFTEPSHLGRLITITENVAQKALKEQRDSEEFITSYTRAQT